MKKLFSLGLLVCLLMTGCFAVGSPSGLSGDNLVVALTMLPEEFDAMTPERRAAYTCACLELEIMNGGLCQFFANNPDCAAYVPEALQELGAMEHLDLYESFLSENSIDPHDPMFQTEDLEEFSKLYDLYPWDDFDNAYCTLMPMPELLEHYVREHSDSFQ